MSESTHRDSSPGSTTSTSNKTKTSLWSSTFLLSVFLTPVLAAVLVYRLDSFDPAPLPTHEFARRPLSVPTQNSRMLQGAEMVGWGKMIGPEDLAYDSDSGVIYTGCFDGWIKRVTVKDSVADSVVEDWVNTGGRPLGLVLGHNNEVIIADSYKGLLNATQDGTIELLSNEAEGVEFKLTDAVDIAEDGMVYFTDASSKYSLNDFIWDMLEGRPYGRLMSYDPSTKRTKVLVRDLYFGNGVVVSPDQQFVVFCETPMRRCKKYYIQGERKGSVDKFIENLPGMPDNILYDGQGQYWIALATAATVPWDLAQRYPFLRKGLAIMEKHIGRPLMEKGGGFLAVDLEGKPIAHYYDPGLALVSSGLKIGDHLYGGSVFNPYIIRLNLTQYPAV